MHTLAYWLGLTNASGGPYLFWSGFGSDLGEFALFGAVAGVFKHHNCYVKGCWRIGRFAHGPFKVCSLHHPDIPDVVTEAVVEAHRRVP